MSKGNKEAAVNKLLMGEIVINMKKYVDIAVIGGALAKKRKGNKIVVSAYEHDSVIKSAKQLEQTAGHAAQARHVGGADVAAAGFAGIDTLERFGDDKAEGDRAEEEGKDHAEGKDEIAHGRLPCWR